MPQQPDRIAVAIPGLYPNLNALHRWSGWPLTGEEHLQAVQAACIAAHHVGKSRFQLIVAAARFMVGAIQPFGAAAQGQFKRAVEGAVAPAALGFVFVARVRAVHDQRVDAGNGLVDGGLALRDHGLAGGICVRAAGMLIVERFMVAAEKQRGAA